MSIPALEMMNSVLLPNLSTRRAPVIAARRFQTYLIYGVVVFKRTLELLQTTYLKTTIYSCLGVSLCDPDTFQYEVNII